MRGRLWFECILVLQRGRHFFCKRSISFTTPATHKHGYIPERSSCAETTEFGCPVLRCSHHKSLMWEWVSRPLSTHFVIKARPLSWKACLKAFVHSSSSVTSPSLHRTSETKYTHVKKSPLSVLLCRAQAMEGAPVWPWRLKSAVILGRLEDEPATIRNRYLNIGAG